MKEFVTACPRNCYSTCTLSVQVEGGRLVAVRPHAGNRATPEGPCLKGLSYVERVVSPDRLLYPQRRARDGSFHRVGWDEALDEIVHELRRVHAGHGPQSVLYYAASGTKGLLNSAGPAFWRLAGGCTTTYGDLCWPAGLEATRLTLGLNEHNAPWDLVNAKLVVGWGKNPAETNVHQMPFLEEVRRAGGSVIVVDPRRTETAERADLLLQPRPGTDGALAAAMACVLFRDDLVDREFVAAHVLGADAYADRVRECTPEWAEDISGVPAAAIERVARALGTIRPATIVAGYGMQRFTNSGQTMRAIIALLALTGNLGRSGAGWQFANLQSAVFDPVRDPIASYPPEVPDGVTRVSISIARLGREMLETTDPPLKMAWVERGNPIPQNPETHSVLRAFRALDFRVVVDQFLTDTAREADLVLPAKTMFEQSDVIGAYWHAYVQLKPKILDPPGEVKPETEIYRALATRLGLPAAEVDAAIPGPTDAEVVAWLEARLARIPGLSLERLAAGPALAPGSRDVAFDDLVFPTPSGKVEILSEEAARRWRVDALPGWTPPVEFPGGATRGRRALPLQILTPNTKNRIHSQFGNLAMIRAQDPEPMLEMSLVDAAARGIADGDRVRVFNDRGELAAAARLAPGLRAGCVSMTNGWWISDGGAVNLLSLGRETDLGHGAAFHDNLVEVERAG